MKGRVRLLVSGGKEDDGLGLHDAGKEELCGGNQGITGDGEAAGEFAPTGMPGEESMRLRSV